MLPAWAGDRPAGAAISGYVRNAAGEAQMGAVVQILGTTNRTFTVFTDGAGYYTASGLLPGLYSLKVTAPSFLPALREKIGLRPGSSLNVNVTLSTLLNVMQLGPVRALPDNDDWKWTLRSVANRPILRVFDDPALNDPESQDHDLRGTLSFVAGSAGGGYGSGSDMSTGFTLNARCSPMGGWPLVGNVGYGEGIPAAVLRAGYSHRTMDGSEPTLGLTVRRFSPSDPNLHNAALQALALSAGDDVNLGDVVELKFGSELQTIQFLGHVTAFRSSRFGGRSPFAKHSSGIRLYHLASRPRAEKGFDSSPADLSESNPRVSLVGYTPKVESAHHQELSLSRRLGKNRVQASLCARPGRRLQRRAADPDRIHPRADRRRHAPDGRRVGVRCAAAASPRRGVPHEREGLGRAGPEHRQPCRVARSQPAKTAPWCSQRSAIRRGWRCSTS